MRRQRILFHCQPTLGLGHFMRSRALVQALDAFDVTFVMGGALPAGFALPPHVDCVTLPPLQFDENFRHLHSPAAGADLAAIQAQRQAQLGATFERVLPDALMVELFPFGRHQFAFELIPLLERARRQGTLNVCSLRDILVGKRKQAEFDARVVNWMNAYFDLLLIHADPQFVRLEETFAPLAEINCDIRYTGYISAPVNAADEPLLAQLPAGQPLIVVSIGGGRVGHELLACALAAQPLIARQFPHHMILLGGPQIPDETFHTLEQEAAGRAGVSLARYATNLPALLKRAALSISLGGYNTCMDVLTAGVRAVIYPFTGNNNQEQTVRAAKLAAHGRLQLLAADALTPAQLTDAAWRALHTPETALPTNLALQGATASAEILAQRIDKLPACRS